MTSRIMKSYYANRSSKRSSHNSHTDSTTSTDNEESAVPDSTTSAIDIANNGAQYFDIGQDVLVKQKDGRYYLGTVVEVNVLREQCLVKFGDNTDRWASFKDLTKLNTSEQEGLLCVVCKKSSPKSKREIIVCDKCGRGYHQICHQPEIPVECQKEDSTWLCKRCTPSESHRLRKSDFRYSKRYTVAASSTSDIQIPTAKVLPYDLSSLNWDTYHRVNNEHTYCYCGESGEWYKQMLQCGRCKQWFHERCLDCLQYPLYCGDRFYVFVCSICNHGKEFVRRLEMKWVDLVHLMLFNLTAYHSKKYYDLDTTIIPYINDNWHALQLPPKISAVSKSERRENILSILTNNRNRFKCGREIKKRVTIWGLRVRLPPPAPTVSLTFSGPVTEEELRERWQGNRRLQFLSLSDVRYNKKIVPCDNHMKNIMMGIAYQQNSNNPSETDSPCPSPDVEQDDFNTNKTSTCDEKLLYKTTDLTGCVKKSGIPLINHHHHYHHHQQQQHQQQQNQGVKRKRLFAAVNGNVETVKRAKRRNTTAEGGMLLYNNSVDTVDEHNCRGGYPTRLSLDNKNYNKTNETLPLTPPTSVSAPPTPPALSSTTSILSDLSNDFVENNSELKNNLSRNINNNKTGLVVDGVNELNTPCDTSGDETSSKSTLDLIIPPPKDFEGKNNPFLTLLRGSSFDEKNNKVKPKDNTITLPLPLTAVIPGKPIMRPTKRQLSEKDIFIGPNGEVKRRRLRRNRSGNFVGSGQTASKTATIVPVKPDNREWKQLSTTSSSQLNSGSAATDYTFNGRKLRQRPDKVQNDTKDSGGAATTVQATAKLNNATNNSSSSNNTNVKAPKEPDISMIDLKSSVNIYFGAANRIAAGEKFSVKAKRIGPSGKMEFLIEWDGPGNGMT